MTRNVALTSAHEHFVNDDGGVDGASVYDGIEGLIAAALSGDGDAWAVLVARFQGLVWSVCRANMYDREAAVDVAQTVWLRLVEHLDRIREPRVLGVWLARTARNECQKYLRKTTRATSYDERDLPERMAPGIEATIVEREEMREMREAIATLSPGCATLLRLLSADPPLSYAEIAEAADVAIGTIGPRRMRCLRHARELLDRNGARE